MKKAFLTISLLMAVTCNMMAQLSAMNYKNEDFAAFKATKTYVVKMGDPSYDNEIEAAMKESWTVTSYDFIDEAEFKTKIADASASFIVPVVIENNGPNQAYHYIAIINGGRKSVKKYTYADMVAYAPLNHWVDEPTGVDCAFRIKNILQSMVQAIELVQKNDAWGNTKNVVDNLKNIYNQKAGKIKDRTLLVCQTSVGRKLTKEAFAGIYPYKFEFCDRDKIAKAIKEKSTDYYYFQPGITLNKSMFVFDPATGEVVYFDYAMMGMTINTDNIKDLVEQIKNPSKK
jgi:hypothetical protein